MRADTHLPGAVYGYAVVNTKRQVSLYVAQDLSELYKKFSICTSKSLGLTSAPHLVGVESHVAATNVVGHFLTADETLALITMELFETLQA
jgi:hypothetical protein